MRSAVLLIVLGGACTLAYLILGIFFLHGLTGWKLLGGSSLGPLGLFLVLGGVKIARRQTRA